MQTIINKHLCPNMLNSVGIILFAGGGSFTPNPYFARKLSLIIQGFIRHSTIQNIISSEM